MGISITFSLNKRGRLQRLISLQAASLKTQLLN